MGQTCDELANYALFDANFALNANYEYHVNANLTWNMSFNNMNVHGSIIIEPNKTLTIDGATIRFADSRHMSYLTNIIVKAGGDLVIKNGAKLTTIASCTESMWDGVIVLGNPALGENLSLQGVVSIKSGSSIWNAIRGIGTGYILNPYQHPFAMAVQTGGVVIAEDASFVNNKYDVVLRQYDTQSQTDYMTPTFSGVRSERAVICPMGLKNCRACICS